MAAPLKATQDTTENPPQIGLRCSDATSVYELVAVVLLLSSAAPPAAKLRSRRRGTASRTDGGQCGSPVADGRCREDTSTGAPVRMQRSASNTLEPPVHHLDETKQEH